MQSAEQYKTVYSNTREQYDHIIKQTRQMIKCLPMEERYLKAKTHIIDALHNRHPRPVILSPTLTTSYCVLEYIQSSRVWDWLIFILSYTFMYLVILEGDDYALKIALEGTILTIFFFDTFIDFYCLSFDNFKKKNKYPSIYFWKFGLLVLMVIDLVVFIVLPARDNRPIRPFRILRAFIPVIFDTDLRKVLISLSTAYKDLLVYIIYYSIIIGGFALIGTKTLTFDPTYSPPGEFQFDEYMSNYNDLSMMIFQTYALATYDNYPDNQYLAVQNYQPNYIYFIVFIFLNMFLFMEIPATILYNKFRETRSKYIIIDQIKQQHSLILAFVTLAQDEKNLTFDTLVKFLFYFYKYKSQYVQYITEICLKLDDNNNQTIQVDQFMELSKILLYNSAMRPPTHDDLRCWIRFRKWINRKWHLKKIVKHWLFDTVVAVLIVIGAVNVLFCLFPGYSWACAIDKVFVYLYLAELILRIVGISPTKFFAERWNIIDTIMVGISAIFAFIPTNRAAFNLIKLFRFFRLAGFIRIVLLSSYFKNINSSIIENVKRVFTTFMEVMPIIVKFFHLFAFTFFIFGILCMQIFFNTEKKLNTNPKYNNFDQFSNFQTFVHSQYLLMQVLTEGSWAVNAWSYCFREPDKYGYIIALFIFMHIVIVTVMANLLKGIFWEVYFTVSTMLDEIQKQEKDYRQIEKENDKTIDEINEVNDHITNNQSFEPDTILKREIIEKKMDIQILKRIKNFQFYEQTPVGEIRQSNRSKIVSKIMEDFNITPHEVSMPKRRNLLRQHSLKRKKTVNQFSSLENIEEVDLQEQMEQFLNRIIVSSKLKYSQIIAYPRGFVKFLNSKFTLPAQCTNGLKFDLNLNPISNPQSINFHLYSMNAIMGLETTTRETKTVIVDSLSAYNLISQQTADQILKSKHMLKNFHIDTGGAVRKMYLSETNQFLVKKFELEYFIDVYGNSFRQINKITLEPILKFEASLTYTLWNLLRYQQVSSHNFFHLITHIEDEMSNKLLKHGSLVKFVYKLDHESDIWFIIEQKTAQNQEVRFIKTGLWTQTPGQQYNTTYYAKDVFNWQLGDDATPQQKTMNEQYMKLFYQSFQTLAFSLNNKKKFFQSNPKYHIYDLYLHNYDVSRTIRKSSFGQLKICNIMMMVLCKEEERVDVGLDNLNYQLSDIKTEPRKRKKEDFILDDDKETYQKLKNMGASDDEKILESEGLPFAYIVNLIKQVSDMLKLHSSRFVNQVEKALNEKYNDVNSPSRLSQELIEVPVVRVTLDQDDL